MMTPDTRHGIQAVLWDMDGTLVQSETLHMALEQEVLEELGVPVTEARYRTFTGQPTRSAYRTLLSEVGLEARLDDALALKRTRAVSRIIDRALPTRGVERVIAEIPMRLVRYALVTSAERYIAEGILGRFGWTWRFEVVVTADDVTLPKPAPEPYLLACERLGVAPEQALAVEDAPHGIRSAKAAGVRVAGLPGTFPPSALGEADFLLSNVGALPGLLSALD